MACWRNYLCCRYGLAVLTTTAAREGVTRFPEFVSTCLFWRRALATLQQSRKQWLEARLVLFMYANGHRNAVDCEFNRIGMAAVAQFEIGLMSALWSNELGRD